MNPCVECLQLEDQALEAVLRFVSLAQKVEAHRETKRTSQQEIEAARIRRAEAAEALWRHSRKHSATALPLNGAITAQHPPEVGEAEQVQGTRIRRKTAIAIHRR